MRRTVTLALSLFLLAGAATAVGFGVASAGASSAVPAVKPRVNITIVAGSKCKPASEFCFKPSSVSVSPSTKVTFRNTTLTTHTITRCTAVACAGNSGGTGTQAGFGVTSLPAGAKYSFVFKGAGTYVYYCKIHGYATMHGTITVS